METIFCFRQDPRLELHGIWPASRVDRSTRVLMYSVSREKRSTPGRKNLRGSDQLPDRAFVGVETGLETQSMISQKRTVLNVAPYYF